MSATHRTFTIVLLTQPQLLRTRFSNLRKVLQGEAVGRIAPKPALSAPPLTKLALVQPTEAQKPAVIPKVQRAWWKKYVGWFLTAVMVVTFALAAFIILPDLYFSLTSGQSAYDEISQAAREERESVVEQEKPPEPFRPTFNENLPEGAWINIPRIGVYSQLMATENPDEALDVGVWMVPDFGRPGDGELPIIVAAHRYGWDWWWQSDYWRYNSFYLLTETEPGDRVEVMYDQRKWVYEIYAAEEGELISDYDADLILYTYKYLRSPIRYFRYAKLLEI